jgi:hypothetical protein
VTYEETEREIERANRGSGRDLRITGWALIAATVLLGAALALGGCSPSHVPPAGHDCVAACQNLRSLSCLANDGRADNGDACEVWYCETPRLPSSTCVSHASSCEAARACK